MPYQYQITVDETANDPWLKTFETELKNVRSSIECYEKTFDFIIKNAKKDKSPFPPDLQYLEPQTLKKEGKGLELKFLLSNDGKEEFEKRIAAAKKAAVASEKSAREKKKNVFESDESLKDLDRELQSIIEKATPKSLFRLQYIILDCERRKEELKKNFSTRFREQFKEELLDSEDVPTEEKLFVIKLILEQAARLALGTNRQVHKKRLAAIEEALKIGEQEISPTDPKLKVRKDPEISPKQIAAIEERFRNFYLEPGFKKSPEGKKVQECLDSWCGSKTGPGTTYLLTDAYTRILKPVVDRYEAEIEARSSLAAVKAANKLQYNETEILVQLIEDLRVEANQLLEWIRFGIVLKDKKVASLALYVFPAFAPYHEAMNLADRSTYPSRSAYDNVPNTLERISPKSSINSPLIQVYPEGNDPSGEPAIRFFNCKDCDGRKHFFLSNTREPGASKTVRVFSKKGFETIELRAGAAGTLRKVIERQAEARAEAEAEAEAAEEVKTKQQGEGKEFAVDLRRRYEPLYVLDASKTPNVAVDSHLLWRPGASGFRGGIARADGVEQEYYYWTVKGFERLEKCAKTNKSKLLEDMLEQLPEDRLGQLPEDRLEQLPKDRLRELLEDMLEQLPEDMLGQLSKDRLRQLSKDRLGLYLGLAPERRIEPLPAIPADSKRSSTAGQRYTIKGQDFIACNMPSFGIEGFGITYYRLADTFADDPEGRKIVKSAWGKNRPLRGDAPQRIRPASEREEPKWELGVRPPFAMDPHNAPETVRVGRAKLKTKGAPLEMATGIRRNAGSVMGWIKKNLKGIEPLPPGSTLSANVFAEHVMAHAEPRSARRDWKLLKQAVGSHLPTDQEWCHLHGHGDGGRERVGNFVSGSKHCNTEQLAIESAQRMWTHEAPDKYLLKTTAYLLEDSSIRDDSSKKSNMGLVNDDERKRLIEKNRNLRFENVDALGKWKRAHAESYKKKVTDRAQTICEHEEDTKKKKTQKALDELEAVLKREKWSIEIEIPIPETKPQGNIRISKEGRTTVDLSKLTGDKVRLKTFLISLLEKLEFCEYLLREEAAEAKKLKNNAPLAAFIRYKIYRKETAGGCEKLFDYTFEGQSEFFDRNQYRILNAAVRCNLGQEKFLNDFVKFCQPEP